LTRLMYSGTSLQSITECRAGSSWALSCIQFTLNQTGLISSPFSHTCRLRFWPIFSIIRKHDVIHKTGSIHNVLPSQEDQAMACTYNMYRRFGEIWSCEFRDVRANKQTNRHTGPLMAILRNRAGGEVLIQLCCVDGSIVVALGRYRRARERDQSATQQRRTR